MIDTFIFRRWVVFGVELRVGVFSVFDVIALVMVPGKAETFAPLLPRLIVNPPHIIPIRARLLPRVSHNHIRDRFSGSVASAKTTALGSQRGRQIRPQYVAVVRAVVFEPRVFGEAVLVSGVAPGGGGLVPFGVLLRHRQVCVVEQHCGGGSFPFAEVGCVREVVAHVVGGY